MTIRHPRNPIWILGAAVILIAASLVLLACGSDDDAKETQPADAGIEQMSLAVAPGDASQIVFAGDREKEYRLYAVEPDGGDRQELTSEFALSPEWSADGETLAFVGSLVVPGEEGDGHDHGDEEAGEHSEADGEGSEPLNPVHGDIGVTEFRLGLLTADRDSTESEEAGEARGEPMYPTVDPESGRVFFQVTPGFTRDGMEGKVKSAIDAVEPGVEGVTTELEGQESFYQPAWSQDGETLAVIVSSCDPRPCSQKLVLYDRSLEQREVLTRDGVAGTPAWSDEGEIAFSWTRGDQAGIWVMERGGTPRQVTTGLADTGPTFSPDGRSLAFGRKCDIFVADIEAGTTRNVTRTPGECEITPAWRPE